MKVSMSRVDSIVREVQRGDGLAHALIYEEDGKLALREAEKALQEAGQILEDVRTKKGLANTLIYDEDKGDFIANLNEVSADVKKVSADIQKIVAEIDRGEGTVGALIKDPTVYEDLKTILGNTKRNTALKALIRLNLQEEDKRAEPK